MTVDIQKLIQMITSEVILQLSKMGVDVTSSSQRLVGPELVNNFHSNQSKIIDMNGYKTPVLTENHLEVLDSEVIEIIIPKGTVITLGAKDIIKKRKLIVINKTN